LKYKEWGAWKKVIVEKVIKELPDLIVEKNLNFLIGSGASTPFFPTLGNIEDFITKNTLSSEVKHLIYAIYFNKVIRKNIDLYNNNDIEHKAGVDKNYQGFISKLTEKMQIRNNRLSPNRVNIFTTNYDLFFEKAVDKILQDNPHIFFNDGANGYFTRILSSDNFHKTMSLNGVFDNYQKEIPMFNLIKCHGSVTWEEVSEDLIKVRNDVKILEETAELYDTLNIQSDEEQFLEDLIKKEDINSLEKAAREKKDELFNFFQQYQNLLIVNPEKSKFQHTVFQEYYYSMLRLLSYELEKKQTILIVFGFSFADEHIKKLIMRSLNNPFLIVYIFAYSQKAEEEIKSRLQITDVHANINIVSPSENDPGIDFSQFNKIIFGG
jgi:hypothetical protein